MSEIKEEEPLGNPAPPPNVDLEKLRGDRIGDTVFSGKWCIQTVMKLMQSIVVLKPESTEDSSEIVDMEEDLQNEVGALWDMTSNVQVCQYLHSVGAVESICHIITNSRCPRATEMCVGMLANIIVHIELWDVMKEDISFFSILIQLLTSDDQLVLLEVSRFFNTALYHKNSDVFYSSLNDEGQLVTQELLRILSGSTNGDLLRQVTECVHSLMYRDEDDSHFGRRFADPDFVMAVVEASKELGWTHESAGQNSVMEVFHCYTTYEAGIVAMGCALEDVSASGKAYLRALCQQGLSLSTNCTVLTSILSTQHHIMTRSETVKGSLLASPSFLHCVLITLVALYRKLGQYHTISGTMGNSRDGRDSRRQQLVTSEGTWQSLEAREEEEAKEKSNALHRKSHRRSPSSDAVRDDGGADLQGSWSERAFARAQASDVGGASGPGTINTPDASPRVVDQKGRHGTRDLEVSWSERRLASPLFASPVLTEVEQGEGEGRVWKRPKERGRLRKKDVGDGEGRRKAKEEIDATEASSETSPSSPNVGENSKEEEEPGEDHTKVSPQSCSGQGARAEVHQTAPVEAVAMSTEEGEAGQDSSNMLMAMRIQGPNRIGPNVGTRLSGGFTPTGIIEWDDEDKDETAAPSSETNTLESSSGLSQSSWIKTDESVAQRGGEKALEKGNQLFYPSSSTQQGATQPGDESSHQNLTNLNDDENDDESAEKTLAMDVGFDYMDKDKGDVADDVEEEQEMSNSMGSSNKYTIFLGVIQELLVDFVHGLTQVANDGQDQHDGATHTIKATMSYLDRQCSSTELRALARCVADSCDRGSPPAEVEAGDEESRSPLKSMLYLCDSFRARRLKSVLRGCFTGGDRVNS